MSAEIVMSSAAGAAPPSVLASRCGDAVRPVQLSHSSPEVLAEIARAGVSMATWERRLRPEAAAWLDGLDAATIDDLVIDPPPQLSSNDVRDSLASAGYPACAHREWLADDITDAVQRFAAATTAASVRLRLEFVETDACRRFHADHVAVRGLVTYRGPGTQWLDPAEAGRVAAGAEVADLMVRSVGTGAVMFMKGRLAEPDAPLVHRSPPIVGTGLTRLLLTIDAKPGSEA